MAEPLHLQSPDFDHIEKETGISTRDAIKLLWTAILFETRTRSQGVRLAQEILAPKVLSLAPTTNQNNLDLQGASVLHFTGTSAVDLTGLTAPESGDTRIVFIHNSGSATITVKHASASSSALNQIRTQSAGNLSLTTDKSLVLLYLSGLWRELKLV